MSESFTAATDDRDWFDEFAPEPATEPAPRTRMLAGATSLPLVTRRKPPSIRPSRRAPERKRTWPYRSMLLGACALVLIALSGSVMMSVWMRAALAPVAVAEWPVSPRVAPVEPARPAALPISPGLTSEIAATESKPAEVPAAAAPAKHPAARAAVTNQSPVVTGNDVSDILAVVERYRFAQSSLNPASVRAVVPAVDISALAHEFANVKRQTLAFDNCKIDVQGDRADAACAGRVSVVPKALEPATGSIQSGIQSRHWTFSLVRAGRSWVIQTVVAR